MAKAGEFYSSEPLCEWQRDVSRRGIVGAEIVESMYGWSVRYDSGLQNWPPAGVQRPPGRRANPREGNRLLESMVSQTRPIATLGRGERGAA